MRWEHLCFINVCGLAMHCHWADATLIGGKLGGGECWICDSVSLSSAAQAGSAQEEMDQNHITGLSQLPPGNRPETFSLQTHFPHSFSKNSCNKWKWDTGNVNKQKTAFPLKIHSALQYHKHICSYWFRKASLWSIFVFVFLIIFTSLFVWKRFQTKTNIPEEITMQAINHFNINKTCTTKANLYSQHKWAVRSTELHNLTIDLFSCHSH